MLYPAIRTRAVETGVSPAAAAIDSVRCEYNCRTRRLSLKGRVDFFVDTVFDYPTLAECYKNGAFAGINRLQS